MSIFDPPTNRLEEIIIANSIFQLYLSYDSKNDGWTTDSALDNLDEECDYEED